MVQGSRIGVATCVAAIILFATVAQAAVVSFLVDPATIDNNPADGFITGNEFSPIGDDGTVFTLTPTNNLVGADRFLLSAANGLSFGGGSGSTLTFDFVTSKDIKLDSYTIGGGLSLNDPIFDIREGATVHSMSNAGDTSGAFVSAPVMINAGTTYSFVVTNTGAAIQRQMASWTYTPVASDPIPTPAALPAALLGLGALVARRRR